MKPVQTIKTGNDIVTATRSYERWLAARITVRPRDLRFKHDRMAESPFVFLRGTFYRWIQQWPDLCPALDGAPRVIAAGRVHVQTFGTRRGIAGRRRWGGHALARAAALPH